MKKNTLLEETASQTAGPYVHIGCVPNFAGLQTVTKADLGNSLNIDAFGGQEITIQGKVYDGDGAPVLDALIEIWQADGFGIYPRRNTDIAMPSNAYTGWGRCASNLETGEFIFKTIKPGKVIFNQDQYQAPHITFWIVARGINIGLQTRMYFAEEAEANKTDPVLSSIKDQSRVQTLIAEETSNGNYRFDIHLQGAQETIFFDF